MSKYRLPARPLAFLVAAAVVAWLAAGAAQAQVQRADLRIDGMT